MKMDKFIWIGHREGELFKTNDFFEYSITTWGSNEGTNISYCEKYKERDLGNGLKHSFIIEELSNLLKDEERKVMFYSPALAYTLMNSLPQYQNQMICLNSSSVLNLLNNKTTTRLWLSNHMPVLDFILLSGSDCQFEQLQQYFPQHDEFVIQEADSAGGLGTYLLNSENCHRVNNTIKKEDLYLASYYASPSYSLNTHILISEDNVVVFPASVQIIEDYNMNLIYSGADFVSYTYLEESIKEKVYDYSKKIASLLQNIGYLGICGVDFLVYNQEVYFIELNPRFQASTVLLNLALNEAGLPSAQELNYCSFYGKPLPAIEDMEHLEIHYSLYKYKKEGHDTSKQYLDKLSLLEESSETNYILYDGFTDCNYSDRAYLFQVIWDRHISSCGKDGKLHLHPNVPFHHFMEQALPLTHTIESIIRLKIALLNQGVRILSEAETEILACGGYNESVFNSLDLIIFDDIRINAPVNINLSSLSPFSLGYRENTFKLFYYRKTICDVSLEFSKSIKNLKTLNGASYKSIAFISGDRLRIKPESQCYFKQHGIGCMFCPGNGTGNASSCHIYTLDDIREVIDYCIDHEQFRHILIGGGSADPSSDDNRIIPVIRYIRSKTDKPIYLMSLPPNDIDYIDKYVEAGADEFAFNIELFDRKLALEYMPGKGKISLTEYISKLERAAQLTKHPGDARTMLMAGLEHVENTLSAVKCLVSKGIQPMISIFRPAPNCRLSHIIQPSNEEIYALFMEARRICAEYGLALGPSCPSCQNNTLAITLAQD